MNSLPSEDARGTMHLHYNWAFILTFLYELYQWATKKMKGRVSLENYLTKSIINL